MSPIRTAPAALRAGDADQRARYLDEVLGVLYPAPCLTNRGRSDRRVREARHGGADPGAGARRGGRAHRVEARRAHPGDRTDGTPQWTVARPRGTRAVRAAGVAAAGTGDRAATGVGHEGGGRLLRYAPRRAGRQRVLVAAAYPPRRRGRLPGRCTARRRGRRDRAPARRRTAGLRRLARGLVAVEHGEP